MDDVLRFIACMLPVLVFAGLYILISRIFQSKKLKVEKLVSEQLLKDCLATEFSSNLIDSNYTFNNDELPGFISDSTFLKTEGTDNVLNFTFSGKYKDISYQLYWVNKWNMEQIGTAVDPATNSSTSIDIRVSKFNGSFLVFDIPDIKQEFWMNNNKVVFANYKQDSTYSLQSLPDLINDSRYTVGVTRIPYVIEVNPQTKYNLYLTKVLENHCESWIRKLVDIMMLLKDEYGNKIKAGDINILCKDDKLIISVNNLMMMHAPTDTKFNKYKSMRESSKAAIKNKIVHDIDILDKIVKIIGR